MLRRELARHESGFGAPAIRRLVRPEGAREREQRARARGKERQHGDARERLHLTLYASASRRGGGREAGERAQAGGRGGSRA